MERYKICLLDRPEYHTFFDTVDNWLNYDPEKCDFLVIRSFIDESQKKESIFIVL